jgi:pSer/pThr/pTyr-binding forkhead associated (FHA) protein
MARLVVITEGVSASTHELGDGWMTVGRADGNTFQIVEPSISGRHCEVQLRGGEFELRPFKAPPPVPEAGTEHIAVGDNLMVVPVAGGEPVPADRSPK